MTPLQEKLEKLKEHWVVATFAGILGVLVILFLLVVSGAQDCDITQIRGGVKQTCRCIGMEITVKSTTNTGEQKTICLGVASGKKTY